MDLALDVRAQKLLEVATYFSICRHPFSKTKVFTFLPRFVIANKFDKPLVLRESGSQHQICLMPQEEIYFNFGSEQKEGKITLRLLDFKQELTGCQSTQRNVSLSPSKVRDEGCWWSYAFSLQRVDDFQVTVANPNELTQEEKTGWSTSEDRQFIRVNISTIGPHN